MEYNVLTSLWCVANVTFSRDGTILTEIFICLKHSQEMAVLTF